MHPHEIPYGEDQFWTALNRRLMPLLGSLPIKFGTRWYDVFERCFTRSDFHAVAMAKSLKRQRVQWFLVGFHGEGLRLMDHDDTMACSTMARAIGYLAGRCNAVGIWPDSFKMDEEKGLLELLLNGEAFASIRELVAANQSIDSYGQRAKSTISGFRDDQSWVIELHKRLKRWPGLKDIGLSSDFPPHEACIHLPLPSEWLHCAKRLGRLSGIENVDTKSAQKISAAVFDVPSWHHLCALATDEFGLLQWEAVSGPWRSSVSVNGDAIESFYSSSPYDAFRSFAELAAEEYLSDSTLEFRSNSGFENMLCMQVESPIKAGESPKISVDFSKVSIAIDEDFTAQRQAITFENGLNDCLSNLFGIGAPASEQMLKRDAMLNRKFLISDGRWRFTKDARDLLAAEELDARGHVTQQAFIPTHKGGIYWHPDLEAYVLTYDYDGKRPVAIVRGIQQETVDILLGHLREAIKSRHDTDWHRGLSEEDKKTLNSLRKKGGEHV